MNKEDIIQFIVHLNIAVTNTSLYSREHDVVIMHSDKCIKQLDQLFEEVDKVQVMKIGRELIINDIPLKMSSLHVDNFIRCLKKKGYERIDITKGITKEEVYDLIVDLAKPKSEPMKPSEHLSAGKVEVRLNIADDPDKIIKKQIDKIRESFDDVGFFKRLNIVGIEDVITNFVSMLKSEVNILNILTPIKSQSEYTYIHATNVAILTMFQAEPLGVKSEALHEIGVSALLHDVGKMYISKDILYKEGKLDQDEWVEIQSHPILGAKMLLNIEGIPRLAPIIALEHHLKYNNTGYPMMSGRTRKQHIISQIVSISDFYDALRQRRPYKEGLPDTVIFELLQKGAESNEFSPVLVNSFLKKLSVFYKKTMGM